MERKQGKTVRSEARNIIRRVINKCDEEARKHETLHPVQQATVRAADYTGVSIKTITRIRKENLTCKEDQPLRSPGKKRPKREDRKVYCSPEDQAIIREIIYDFYLVTKIVPTAPKLLPAIQEKIYFPWKLRSLYRLLQRMGFKWKKTNSIKKILIEKPNIVTSRVKYLEAIKYYRTQNRNIIYIDETWVDSNTLCFNKYWQSEDVLGFGRNTNSSHQLVLIHAGGQNGFIKGADLIFKSNTPTDDYHGQITAVNFEKWVNEKLLPNIPPKSVIVMDNAPYHSEQLNEPPSKYSKKECMIQWLVENNIIHSPDMRKCQLMELIQKNKKSETIFKMDEMLKLYGHSTLRLPPYMCDLNPVRLAWSQIQKKLQERNTSVLLTNELETYTIEAINEVTQSDWHNFCTHVENLEKEYWWKDGLIEEVVDNFPLQSDESESDFSDESTSSED